MEAQREFSGCPAEAQHTALLRKIQGLSAWPSVSWCAAQQSEMMVLSAAQCKIWPISLFFLQEKSRPEAQEIQQMPYVIQSLGPLVQMAQAARPSSESVEEAQGVIALSS
ncbi:hypothetical protein Salat_1795100 [Sesamum alatum]|uniref:Uncharacterized protein n=1 Tax=Sesamum alatum TaxID=300844 RepID=A0AAE1Y2Y9_9LAMI|nr:hypothetical protein Salat_1794600 [Sesamum alatum]KAK4422128.1 hypothetical protein Salat_1795100 [Sesamum alatum]